MPVLSKEFKLGIENIPVGHLQKLVLKLARSNKEVYDMINHKYLLKEEDGQELFDETKAKIDAHFFQFSSRGPIQKSIARSMGKAIREINYYAKITGNKNKEADLLNYLLGETFSNYSDYLGTCWTAFDSKIGTTTKRFLNLVTKKLHEDLLLDYREDINNYLNILHRQCDHLDSIYLLPKSI